MQRRKGDLWAVVMAAADEAGVARLTCVVHGRVVPKQFAVLDGKKSLLAHTVERALRLCPANRVLVVVGESHQDLAKEQLKGYAGVTCVTQPVHLGSAPEMMLPLWHILARDPQAQVIFFPADHYVRKAEPFVAAARQAVAAAVAAEEGIALVAAAPEEPGSDLGWVVPEPVRSRAEERGSRFVHRFIERPPHAMAELLCEMGALVNTMVVAGRGEALKRLFAKHLHGQAAAFDAYIPAIGSARERERREELYWNLLPADFGREVLEEARGVRMVASRDTGWSNLATPERVLRCVDERSPHHRRLRRAGRPTEERPPIEPAVSGVV